MTDTDRATERFEDALIKAWPNIEEDADPEEFVKRLTAQGFGHQSDILRAFAEYEMSPWLTILVDRHLASLAAKGEGR